MNTLPGMLRYCLRLAPILPHRASLAVRTNTNTPTDTPSQVSFQQIATALEFQAEEKIKPTTPLPLSTSVPKHYMAVLKILQNTNKIYIKVCKHNIIATLTSPSGQVIHGWATCGLMGFKNARKRTEFASTKVGRCIGEKALAKDIDSVHLKIKGINIKRRIATVKGIIESGVKILAITDNNRLAFGDGPKPPAVRSL